VEYANSVWCPYNQGDIKELEKIQKGATKLVINFKKMPYKDRLMHLKFRVRPIPVSGIGRYSPVSVSIGINRYLF